MENVVLIRFLPNADERAGRLAQGMSGSPVYVRGKLIGAVGSGWEFGDHRLALVTPIDGEHMNEAFIPLKDDLKGVIVGGPGFTKEEFISKRRQRTGMRKIYGY